MTDFKDDEDNYPARPRWIGWAIVIFMVAAALGVANIGWRIMQVSPTEKATEALVQQHPELAPGKKLLESSDCMRCHGWDNQFVGPAFTSIAERYRGQADAEQYLAGKIRGGSVGVWGKVIMPRQMQVNEEQALQIARWLLAAERAAP